MAEELESTEDLVTGANVRGRGYHASYNPDTKHGRIVSKSIDVIEDTLDEAQKFDPKDEELKRERARKRTLTRLEGAADVTNAVIEIAQAVTSYNQFSDNVDRNIRLIDSDIGQLEQDASRLESLGHQKALREKARGDRIATHQKLSSVAQGQRIGSAGAKRLSTTHKLIAATRATQEINASLSRALGLKYEQVKLGLRQADLNRQKAAARVNRNLGIAAGLTKAAAGGLSIYNA